MYPSTRGETHQYTKRHVGKGNGQRSSASTSKASHAFPAPAIPSCFNIAIPTSCTPRPCGHIGCAGWYRPFMTTHDISRKCCKWVGQPSKAFGSTRTLSAAHAGAPYGLVLPVTTLQAGRCACAWLVRAWWAVAQTDSIHRTVCPTWTGGSGTASRRAVSPHPRPIAALLLATPLCSGATPGRTKVPSLTGYHRGRIGTVKPSRTICVSQTALRAVTTYCTDQLSVVARAVAPPLTECWRCHRYVGAVGASYTL